MIPVNTTNIDTNISVTTINDTTLNVAIAILIAIVTTTIAINT